MEELVRGLLPSHIAILVRVFEFPPVPGQTTGFGGYQVEVGSEKWNMTVSTTPSEMAIEVLVKTIAAQDSKLKQIEREAQEAEVAQLVSGLTLVLVGGPERCDEDEPTIGPFTVDNGLISCALTLTRKDVALLLGGAVFELRNSR